MQNFLIRLLIVALVIWLVQVVLEVLGLESKARQILMVITLIVSILWLLFGYVYLGAGL